MNWFEYYKEKFKGLSDAERKTFMRREAMKQHPDRGGDAEAFSALLKAYDLKQPPSRCTLCEGRGFYREKNGHFTRKVQCPNCWKVRI